MVDAFVAENVNIFPSSAIIAGTHFALTTECLSITIVQVLSAGKNEIYDIDFSK